MEAKGVKIANENQTLASVTFQNYGRMTKSGGHDRYRRYGRASFKIYNLDVNVVPTNWSMIRKDYADVVFRTEKEKFTAIVEEIKDCHERRQPVLVEVPFPSKNLSVWRATPSRNGITQCNLNASSTRKKRKSSLQASP